VKLEVIQSYGRLKENPIACSRGERLTLVIHDQDHIGWIWCIATNGREGWVHNSFLEIDGGEATARRDYTGLELNVTIGEELEGLELISLWWFCRNTSGETGWVPVENVSSREATGKALITQIETAFANVTKGNGVELRESAANDAGVAPKQDRSLDVEQRWQELSDSLFEEYPMALIFTDGEGFRFLLPAFMRYAVKHLENPDANEIARDHAFQNLCKPDGVPENLVAFHGFRTEETSAIAQFVRFFAGHNPSHHELEQIHLWESLAGRA
jgi:Variant SH3 domain